MIDRLIGVHYVVKGIYEDLALVVAANPFPLGELNNPLDNDNAVSLL